MDIIVPSNFPTAAIYGEQEAGRAATVRKEVESLIRLITTSTFDIAEYLYEIQSNKYYADWGFDSFKDYISTLKIKPRKAQYLIRMIEVMTAVAVDRSVYEPIGISKLRDITSLDYEGEFVNPQDGVKTPWRDIIRGLVDRAEAMEPSDIKKAVRVLKGLTAEDELVWINFCVKQSVLDEVVRPALSLAKLVIGDAGRDDDGNAIEPSDGAALEVIAVEFMNDPANQPNIKETIE